MSEKTASANKLISRDLLIQDVRQLAHILETAHPDPYINGGGKIAFHRRFQRTLRSIPEQGMTKAEFYRLLLPFVAAVGDGHTFLHTSFIQEFDSYDPSKPGGIPPHFDIVEESLYVHGVPEEEYKNLIGARLVSVEGVPFGELFERMKRLRGVENEYNVLINLAKTLRARTFLQDLIPEWKDKSRIRVLLELPTGEKKDYVFTLPIKINYPLITTGSKFTLPSTEKCDFVYDFLDQERKTALLRVDNMSTYREAFEMWHADGTNIKGRASDVYKRFHGKEPPESLLDMIAGIPSATETFRSLVIDMKKAGTKNLLIDIRKNGGGNSRMTDILIYFLFGKERLLKAKAESGWEISKYSDLYFKNKKNVNLEDINKDRKFPLTKDDYDFKYDFTDDPQKLKNLDIKGIVEGSYKKMPTFYAEYKSGKYSGYYCPERIMVLCSPWTFSSGYGMMIYFYKLGALLIGTPSGQSGNCFGDVLIFELNNTDLSGYVSHKQFIDFPDDPEKARVLRPHFVMTYNKLASYNFDENTEILFALEMLPKVDKINH